MKREQAEGNERGGEQEKLQGELDRHHDKQLSRSWRTNEHFITKVRHVDGGNCSRGWEREREERERRAVGKVSQRILLHFILLQLLKDCHEDCPSGSCLPNLKYCCAKCFHP